ncbi:fumarate reductase/succinate dehydrogenase flavoprotein-like FrdA [Sphaerisporangium siamense]|uniref:Succinate dehydrogenase/fumarate reductase flavoprotein subunit/HEAT repeat protein n=1 Tax=Sphaerisporangium siamense TaxID=795645 RepID=A0A7W7GEW3_9ACTN|nr:fumarate reductase/succinate dehydrogenase flavoprotein subunit [Sphaerisporangium siamense]MBB4705804.1 succinate dehydrogenase/fumarate reductase flavoprotein subunit/HEAT repeat protein [Sphaerisporangium siamense]GII82808.1 fumarate reductase/succinate dehydrogenase flavoprotein-like FrdA [Sphaerisporangium siamense]
MMEIPSLDDRLRLSCEVLVVGGGTAGTMAAITAAERGADVILLEKAHVRHSGALAMGMDGVNNAVIPGRATPEDYVAEITRANDGVVNQRTVHQTATRGYEMVRRLERYGVKFEKDEHGEYNVRRVHRSGSYVLPMPEGKDVKKVLYRVLRRREIRERVRVENRVMPVRVLVRDGRAVGVAGFDTRSGRFVTVSAGAVILATGAGGRLGLPASGYLYGTYENPTNAGDGHAMAYHAGAELSGIECFQINPLIKDYNGPACAYVANPFGGYQVNNQGERFVDCDYWSGQMMAEVAKEIGSARGPIYLKLSHLPGETITALEDILHTTERPTRGTFHAGRGHDYRTHDVEMHISEIGLCGGHSASGVWVDENGATTVPGLYAAGDLACVPHNYMIGAFVFGDLAGAHASQAFVPPGSLPEDQIADAHALVYRPLRNPGGPPQPQVEYKLRRFVNDYVAPPKSGAKLRIALETFERMRGEIAAMGARTPHELMRCVEVDFIRDCAEMAARASLVRDESRWGLYHDRADVPGRDDERWLYHLNLRKDASGRMSFVKRPVEPYLVPVEGFTPRATAPVELGPHDPSPAGTPAAPDGAGPAHDAGGPGNPRGRTAAARRPAVETIGRSPRILELVRLAEEQPPLSRLAPYLSDPDPKVRRAAVVTLTETTPDGVGEALVQALGDAHGTVRRAAATGLRELLEILPPSSEFGRLLHGAATAGDPVARAAVLEALRALRLGGSEVFATALADPDPGVRIAAVRGLVSLDDAVAVARAAADPSREVRVTAAKALGTMTTDADAVTGQETDEDFGGDIRRDVGDGGDVRSPVVAALAALAEDPEPLVRAAALGASAGVGAPPPLLGTAVRCLAAEASWEVRVGAARGLSAAPAEVAIGPLASALADPNLDVRKAAVLALSGFVAVHPDAADALRPALADSDADVRAYARRALDTTRLAGQAAP